MAEWEGKYGVPVFTSGMTQAAALRALGVKRMLGFTYNTGELPGMPPTRRAFSVHAVVYCELDPARERLWRVRAFFDLYDAAMQLGVLPSRGTMGEKALMMLRGFGLRAGRG